MADSPGLVMAEESMSGSHFTGLSASTLTLRNLESLLLNAQQQQLRHLRRLQQIRHQAEAKAVVLEAAAEKEAAQQRRHEERRAEAREAQARRLVHAREVEARSAAVQEAANRSREAWQDCIRGKLEVSRQRAEDVARHRSLLVEFARVQAARFDARRRAIAEGTQAALESRRAAFDEKVAGQERIAAQRKELRLIQEEVRREEAALEEVKRGAARQRLEEEDSARRAYYCERAQQRGRQLTERKHDSEAQRAARAEEARRRAAAIGQRSAQLHESDECRRARLAAQLQEKMAKVDAVVAQREALVKEVQRVHVAMSAQEGRIRSALAAMQLTGKVGVIPTELLDTTAALQTALQAASAPGSRTSTLRGGAGSGALSGPASLRLASAGGLRKAFSPRGAPGARAPPSPPPHAAAEAARDSLRASKREAELQRVLQEEILHEMGREQALAQEADPEARKQLVRRFAGEREVAKLRILSVGSHLAPADGGQ